MWLGFGVLAVVPWQVLCGQDQPSADPSNETEVNASARDEVPTIKQAATDGSSETAKRRSSSTESLIIRGQNAPMDPMAMTPLQISPQDRSPEAGDSGYLQSDLITGRSGQATGNLFRIGGFTGPAVGRKVSIFPIEWMPYSLIDNNLFFVDIRAFRGSTDTWGMNAGGGYRYYSPKFDRIFGVNAFFDYDNTSGPTFRQVGFGLESLGALFDVRANAYLPTGTSAQQLSLVNVDGSQKFFNHFLLANQQRTIANALHGFDGEIGVPIPGPIPERHDLRVFGGGYWYEGTEVAAFGGWRTRVQANVIPSVSLQLEVSHDQQFKTNVVFGGSWSYGGFRQSPEERKTQYNRMTTPVIRNYNMIVGTAYKFDKDVEVIDPTTNKPYFFEHVDTNATAPGDGTVEHPFTVFANAQNAGPHDIIFVHANSVFNGVPVNLEPNVRVLGEASSVEHAVATIDPNSNSSLGNTLLLPHPTAIPTGATQTFRPQFNDSPAPQAVNLANNSEFSGFVLNNPLGIGINGNGVGGNIVVRQTDVIGSGAQGVLLTNTSGTILFQGDKIDSPAVSAALPTTFEVDGTKGSILFTSDPLSATLNAAGVVVPTPGIINNIGTGAAVVGDAVVVRNTVQGSSVDFTGSTITSTNSFFGGANNGSVLLTNNAGSVTLGNVNITNSGGIGLLMLNDSGLTTTDGVININGSVGDSLVVEGLTSTGGVQFIGTGANTFDVNITNRGAAGVVLASNAGNVLFSTGLSVAAALQTGAGVGPAIEYQSSSGNATFNNIRVTGGANEGILIGDPAGLLAPNTGRFTVNGNTAISEVTGIGIEVTHDKSSVTFASALNSGTTTIDKRGDIGIEILANQGPVTFNGATTITNGGTTISNSTPVTQPGVDIRQNNALTAAVRFSTLNVEGALGPSANASLGRLGVGVNIGGSNIADANAAPVSFNVLNIGNLNPTTGGTSFYVNNEGQGVGASATGLTVAAGTINTLNGTAVDIENSNINVNLTSVSSVNAINNAPAAGILLQNDALTGATIQQLDTFMFTVGSPTITSQTSGGTISGAIDGIKVNQTNSAFFQTGGVSINNMTLITNQIGIQASRLEQLNVSNSNISQNSGGPADTTNTGAGIDASDIPRINITQSLFDFNGTTLFDHAIYLHTTTPLLQPPASSIQNPTAGRYLWNISNNTNLNGFLGGFTGQVGTGDLVLVTGGTAGGSALQYQVNTNPIQIFPVPLVFQFTNNAMTVQAGPGGTGTSTQTSLGKVAGVDVTWVGQIDHASTVINLTSSITNNTFNLQGSDIGIGIQNPSTAYTTNFTIDGNVLTATGGGNNGIFVNNFGQTNLDIGTGNGNNFTFITPLQNVNGTFIDYGMNISVQNSTINTSVIGISNNTITMSGGPQNQAILFPNMQAPATVTMNANAISITNAALIQGQAIDFALISKPSVVLNGTVSNVVSLNGSLAVANSAAWFNRQPVNSTTGQIIINGYPGP